MRPDRASMCRLPGGCDVIPAAAFRDVFGGPNFGTIFGLLGVLREACTGVLREGRPGATIAAGSRARNPPQGVDE
jgi:hypothetical protein